MRPEQKLLHGPALLAVLKLLELEPRSSYELAAQLRAACPEALALGDASLLALLYYLEAHHLATGSWSDTAAGRRRAYALTKRGRQRLQAETRQWHSLAALLNGEAPAEEPSA
jgi:DNA-binding PadR family transcriptional regulator